MSKSDRKRRQPKSGKCRVCGCAEKHACLNGCSWVDVARTLCSECEKWVYRATKAGASDPSKMPVYGLWIIDGGPNHLGHWLVNWEPGDAEFDAPALFFEREQADKVCAEERANGLDVVVVLLRPTSIENVMSDVREGEMRPENLL